MLWKLKRRYECLRFLAVRLAAHFSNGGKFGSLPRSMETSINIKEYKMIEAENLRKVYRVNIKKAGLKGAFENLFHTEWLEKAAVDGLA